MSFKSGSWKIIVTFFIVTSFEYRKITTDAETLFNVRKTHKLQPRSLLFPPTAPTRVQVRKSLIIFMSDFNDKYIHTYIEDDKGFSLINFYSFIGIL